MLFCQIFLLVFTKIFLHFYQKILFSLHIENFCLFLTSYFFSIDKTKVMCLLLHSADVSHPTKTWDLHKEWTSRCMEEFFKQGDKEKELGLDISPLCDRNTTQVPQSQIGINNILPLI